MLTTMKRVILILTMVATGITVGCDLDRYPETEMSEQNFWNPTAEAEFEYAANYLYTRQPHFWGDMRGDDLRRRNYPSDISAGTRKVPATSSDWSDPYKIIFAANRIIEHAPERGTTANQIDRYVAEAYFFRASAYYALVTKFGGVPILTQTATDINDPILYGPRATRAEVMTQIYNDLDQAALDLPLPSEMATNEYGRITRTAAWALKARAALYEGTRSKYHDGATGQPHLQAAYEAAWKVIESGEHSLYKQGTEPYKLLFEYAGEGASEHIWVKLYGYPETQILTHNMPYQYAVNYGVTRNFLNLYLQDTGEPYVDEPELERSFNDYFEGRDPRLAQTVLKRGVQNYQVGLYTPTVDGFRARKWVRNDKESDQPSTLDCSLLRYAEVLVTYAEARFEATGKITDEELNQTINLVRDRVGMPPLTNAFVDAHGLDMLTELRRERSVELALEGQRYDDLIRWKQAEKLLPVALLGGKFIAGEYGNTSLGTMEERLNEDDIIILEEADTRFFDPERDYLYPIPSNDIAQSKGAVKQNPNWK